MIVIHHLHHNGCFGKLNETFFFGFVPFFPLDLEKYATDTTKHDHKIYFILDQHTHTCTWLRYQFQLQLTKLCFENILKIAFTEIGLSYSSIFNRLGTYWDESKISLRYFLVNHDKVYKSIKYLLLKWKCLFSTVLRAEIRVNSKYFLNFSTWIRIRDAEKQKWTYLFTHIYLHCKKTFNTMYDNMVRRKIRKKRNSISISRNDKFCKKVFLFPVLALS